MALVPFDNISAEEIIKTIKGANPDIASNYSFEVKYVGGPAESIEITSNYNEDLSVSFRTNNFEEVEFRPKKEFYRERTTIYTKRGDIVSLFKKGMIATGTDMQMSFLGY